MAEIKNGVFDQWIAKALDKLATELGMYFANRNGEPLMLEEIVDYIRTWRP